jgi:hypothetical protein
MTSSPAQLCLSVAALVFFFATVCGQNTKHSTIQILHLCGRIARLGWHQTGERHSVFLFLFSSFFFICHSNDMFVGSTSESTAFGAAQDCPNVKLLLNQTWRDCHANSGASLEFNFTGESNEHLTSSHEGALFPRVLLSTSLECSRTTNSSTIRTNSPQYS